MGLMDKVKGALGSKQRKDEIDEQTNQFADEFEDDFEDGEDEGDWDDEEPEDEPVWDNPYQFAGDTLEPDGFASMTDFIVKSMYYECSNSPLYRDRIAEGAETIQMVSSSVENLRSIQGGGDSKDYGDVADQLQDMDRAVRAAESLSGKEDQIIQDGMNLAREAIGAIGNAANSRNGTVDTDVREREGNM